MLILQELKATVCISIRSLGNVRPTSMSSVADHSAEAGRKPELVLHVSYGCMVRLLSDGPFRM